MPGQLIARGENTWLVRIPRGRDSKGKRLYHNKTIRGTKKDAERYRTKVLRDMDTDTFVEASERAFGEYLTEWLETSAKPRIRERTYLDYKSLADRYLRPALGHRKLLQITAPEIQAVYAAMLARGLSPRTVRYAHSVVHSALEQAVKWRMLARNPAKLVDLPRTERREMRSLTAEEASRFLATSNGTRWHALWTLLLTSGLRPGEALGLRWADLDGDRLRIQRTLIRGPEGRWQLVEPKTPKARRVVSLPPSARKALIAHRTLQIEERLRAGATWEDLDLMFSGSRGGALDYRLLVARQFKPIARAAGLPNLRPYDLRHSCATLLLASGENVKVVSERLGHASATLTLDTYSHVLPDMQQRAADRLEDLLFARTARSTP
jgi:integrase